MGVPRVDQGPLNSLARCSRRVNGSPRDAWFPVGHSVGDSDGESVGGSIGRSGDLDQPCNLQQAYQWRINGLDHLVNRPVKPSRLFRDVGIIDFH